MTYANIENDGVSFSKEKILDRINQINCIALNLQIITERFVSKHTMTNLAGHYPRDIIS